MRWHPSDSVCQWVVLEVNCLGDFDMDIWATYSDLIRRSYVMSKGLIWVFPKILVPPKSSNLIGFSIINHPFWGTPIFGNTHMYNENVEGLIELILWTDANLVSPKCEPAPGEETKKNMHLGRLSTNQVCGFKHFLFFTPFWRDFPLGRAFLRPKASPESAWLGLRYL